MRRIRTAVVDVDVDLPALDWAGADQWRVLVMQRGVPRAHLVLASPGGAGPATLELTVGRAALRAREDADYRRRLEPAVEPRPLRVSVVIPTHRRPEVLASLLASVTALDPSPDEVIVVDNDPGPVDCRPLVDAAGFRYLREDQRGLNVARRTGLLAAGGDVVVFTDDDCIVSPGWLAALPEVFADPVVAVAAGPGFAFELLTGAQLRREEEAGFAKGLTPRRFDWRRRPPSNAGAVGSGNSMAVRRDVAVALEVFPPELDAGTRAPAAGDLFAIFRMLSAGFDAVYEPRMVFWHRHPPAGLRDTIRNYGHGAGAFYTKLLVEERELPVLRVWWWFVRRWLEAVLDAQSGLADRGRLRVRWSYLKASLMGPLAWRRALSDLDADGRGVLEASRRAASLAPAGLSDRRLATLAQWREAMRRDLGEPPPAATATADWIASGSRGGSAPAALVAILDLLEWLRFRGAWAWLAARARGDAPPATDARRRMPRAEWRAAAHEAAGRPGRSSPERAASRAVVIGPAHGDAERAAARAAGFTLVDLAAEPRSAVADAAGHRRAVADAVGHWRAVADAVTDSDAEVLALPLPGVRVDEPWLSEVVAALEGSRVAAVVGAGLADADPPSVLSLSGREDTRIRFSGAGSPPQFIAVRRDLYDVVGGIDPDVAHLGWTAPVLDYVERALDAGLTIARLDTHGIQPAGCHRPARSLGEWHRAWARGGLHARRAATIGGLRGLHAFVFAGVVPLLRFRRPDRAARRSLRHAAGSVTGFLFGAAASLARPQPRGRHHV